MCNYKSFASAHDNFGRRVERSWNYSFKAVAMASKECYQPCENGIEPLPEKILRALKSGLAKWGKIHGKDTYSHLATIDILAGAIWQAPDIFADLPSAALSGAIYAAYKGKMEGNPAFEGQEKRAEIYKYRIITAMNKFFEKREMNPTIKSGEDFTKIRYRFANIHKENAVISFVRDALLNPYSCLWLPVAKQWELSSAMMSLDSPKRISVAVKGVTNDRRLARKATAVVGDILCYIPVQLHRAQRDKFLALFSMYWDWVTESKTTPILTYGEELAGVYADEYYVHSCMSCNPRNALGLYVHNPDVTRILYLTDSDNRVTQRALIHKTSYKLANGEELWAFDRLYTPTYGRRYTQSSITECLVDMGKADVIHDGNTASLHIFKMTVLDSKNNNKKTILKLFHIYEGADWNTMRELGFPCVEWTVHPDGWMPYIDSFYNIQVTNKKERKVCGFVGSESIYGYCAHSGSNHHTCWWEDGNDEDDDDDDEWVFSEYEGRRIHRDEAWYSEYQGDWISTDNSDFVWVSSEDDYIHIDNASYCEECGEHYRDDYISFYEDIYGNSICEDCIGDRYSECVYAGHNGYVETSYYRRLRYSEQCATPYDIWQSMLQNETSMIDSDDVASVATEIMGENIEDQTPIVVSSYCDRDYIAAIKEAAIRLNAERLAEEEELCEIE